MLKLRFLILIVLVLALAACDTQEEQPSGVANNSNRNIPSNAIQIEVLYAPESEQFMPEIIRRFNEAYAAGNNPLSGQPLADGERPVYVTGSPPQGSMSSGGVMQGIVNAAIGANVSNTLRPTLFAPSVSHWLTLANLQAGRQIFDVAEAVPTAISPVVIAIWESRLDAIKETLANERGVSLDEVEVGWDELLGVLNSENGWEDYNIINTDGRRAVYYGHADPLNSSTSLSTLIMEFYACARQNGFTGRRLELEQVRSPEVQACVNGIEQLVKHYSRRTEDFLEYVGQGPDYLDFLAVEETDIICLNTGGQQGDEQCNQPVEPLVALYPKEGTFWHEHPIAVVNADWVTPEQREAARIFIDFIILPAQQELVVQYGFRPNPSANLQLGYPFVPENGVSPEGPGEIIAAPSQEVLVALQESWSLVRKQADVILLFDVSGSMMNDGKMDQAKQAAEAFIEGLESYTRIGLVVFSDSVREVVPLDRLETNRYDIAANIRNLRADGGTELYQAIAHTVEDLNNVDEVGRIRAVVLLSDGADTGDQGYVKNDALAAIQNNRDSRNPVFVIPLAYGEDADTQTLLSIARASATRMIFGDPGNIEEVLRLISSYF